MANPYRNMGYSAKLDANDIGDFLQIWRNGDLVCEIAVSVFPEGPNAPASIKIKRFRQNELQSVTVTDDFDGRDEE